MSILLLIAIVTYGNMVLTGVVEEKANRVVEVLLARMPARNLLAARSPASGCSGSASSPLTALAAFVATLVVGAVELPAVSGGVLAWVVVWFVLGYAIYAMAYGALGSLASRSEDASSVAGPVSYVLLAGYWASYIAVANDPDSGWSRLVSMFPATAPFAMPGRIALGAAAWWEPVLAVFITLAAIATLVVVAGRVYTGAILHTGPTLSIRDAWRGTALGSTARPDPSNPGARGPRPEAWEVRRAEREPPSPNDSHGQVIPLVPSAHRGPSTLLMGQADGSGWESGRHGRPDQGGDDD